MAPSVILAIFSFWFRTGLEVICHGFSALCIAWENSRTVHWAYSHVSTPLFEGFT